jgi:hypothetical protein
MVRIHVGNWRDADAREIRATTAFRLLIKESSTKVRQGDPDEDQKDLE